MKNLDPIDAEEPIEKWRSRLKPPTVKATVPKTVRPDRPRTVNEAAEELGLSSHTIRAWIANRKLTYLRFGRAIRIPAEELRRVIKQSTVQAVPEED